MDFDAFVKEWSTFIHELPRRDLLGNSAGIKRAGT
jgi:hypothetical protein